MLFWRGYYSITWCNHPGLKLWIRGNIKGLWFKFNTGAKIHVAKKAWKIWFWQNLVWRLKMSFAVFQTSIWSIFHWRINFNIDLRARQTIHWFLSIWLLLQTREWSIRMKLGLCGLAVFDTILSHKFYCFTVIDTWPGRCCCRLLVLKWVFLFHPTLGENIYTVAFFVGSRKWSPLFFYW